MKRKGPKGSDPKYRLYFVFAFFIVFFSAIFMRAFQLQVVDSKSLKKMAARQHRKTVNIQSKRGDIYDRNLKELAVSIEVDSIHARPADIESPRTVAKVLSPIVAIPSWEIEKKLKTGNFVWIKRQVDITDEQRKIIKELDGIGISKESRRFYPNRRLASNLIGFTGLDSNGLEGIERYYDDSLKGASRKFVGDKDAMGRLLLFEDLDKTVPVQGMVVELTIDKTIQYIAEKELKKAVEDSGAEGGTVIVMDPRTGEILAMASLPTYDLNDAKASNASQRRNRPITDVFEPGSIFKLFLISAALEEKVIKQNDLIFCENGSYRVADRVFHDTKSHGWLTVPQIIKLSSNIGSAKIGERLGKVQLYRYLKAFGFGGKTGIDLPGEGIGSLRNYANWSGVTLQTISFGQGISATGIQLVTAISAVANGGFLMQPYIVKKVKDPSGNIVSERNPVVVRRIISTDTAKTMTEMLVGVTEAGGTGTKAALEGFEVAGKTGTAQKPDFRRGGYASGAFMASFMGFVPAENPRLAIIVAIDEPHGDYHGGTVAAPVFREVARQSLPYLGVFPDKSIIPAVEMASAEPVVSPVSAESESVIEGEELRPMSVPDFSGKTVRTVLRMARGRAFEVEVVGSGKAVSQKPQAGQNPPSKGPVTVYFQ